MGGDAFPALGFDPAPGIVPAVENLTAQVRDAVVRLGSTEQDLDATLRDPNRWRGQAGAEFHTTMRGMVANAGVTKDCLFAVQLALAGWSALLSDYQLTRQSLEEQAAAARTRLAQAKAAPGMSQKPHGFENKDEYDAKSAAYNTAKADVDAADGALDAILKAAHGLKDMHRESAKTSAQEIRNAVQRMTGDQWKQQPQHQYPSPPPYYPIGPGGVGLPGQENADYQTMLAMYFDGQGMPGHATTGVVDGPKVPGNGIVMCRFFIPDEKAAFGTLYGDGRGFTTDPNAPYRMVMLWDTDTGKIVFDVAPSHTTGFVFDKGEIKAQPVGEAHADWKDWAPVMFRNNEVKITPGETGVTVDVSGLNSLLPMFATDQKIQVDFPGGQGAPPHIKLDGDDYPNFETVQYFPNKPPVAQAQDTQWNPPAIYDFADKAARLAYPVPPGTINDPALAAAGLNERHLQWVGSEQVKRDEPVYPPVGHAAIVNQPEKPAPMPVDDW